MGVMKLMETNRHTDMQNILKLVSTCMRFLNKTFRCKKLKKLSWHYKQTLHSFLRSFICIDLLCIVAVVNIQPCSDRERRIALVRFPSHGEGVWREKDSIPSVIPPFSCKKRVAGSGGRSHEKCAFLIMREHCLRVFFLFTFLFVFKYLQCTI